MDALPSRRLHAPQAGFSMVEMLMAALILAIGILGVTMMQLMAIRATRGSKNLTTAVHLAEQVLDQAELEGRLTWLNVSDNDQLTPADITTLKYLGQKDSVVETFTQDGKVPDPEAADPKDRISFFTSTFTEQVKQAKAEGCVGAISDVTVVVEFVEAVSVKDATPVKRNVTLVRRLVHG